jgi:hypothetical protein
MFFTDKSELKFLNFKSREPFFNLAQVEWQEHILNSPEPCDLPIVDLSHEELGHVLYNLYGQLTFTELCELHESIKLYPLIFKSMNWQPYFQKSQMIYNQRFVELSQALLKTTLEFRSWCHTRKLSSQDLMPINALNDFDQFNILSLEIIKGQLTRNEGKNIIDQLVDLILLKVNPILLAPISIDAWSEQLNRLRNPNTTDQDKLSTEFNWPKYVKFQKQRQGDRVLQKIQITFSDQKDLRDKLTRLKSLELS